MEFAQKLFSTRGGTLLIAGLAAVLAAVAVFVYVHNYRSSVQTGGQPATVLVARAQIPRGTSGNVVAAQHYFQATQIREADLRPGALSDPSSLAGRVARVDIYPGQQLTDADFIQSRGTIATNLVGAQRAIVIPLDAAHGLIGTVIPGDHVDIYGGFNVIPIDATGKPAGTGGRPVLRLIAANVPVMSVSGGGKNGGIGASTSGSGSVTLKVPPVQASELAFASDNGKIWLVLRPPTGGRATPPNLVTIETILLGIPPVEELKTFGGRR